ncbi:MAG: hypothetical protein CL843_18025 [Crocinitomicaceae bacterium]|nr:hypothetical protein [Crocinitomicaceae bacterium]
MLTFAPLMKKGESFGKEFLIPFGGEKLGKHPHDFEIGKAFFDSGISEVEVLNAAINLLFILEKQSAMLTLHFNFDGTITVPCDRCNAPVEIPIQSSEKLYVKFSQGGFDTTDEVITIADSESHIDLGPYVYEFIWLALPMKFVHDEGECDQDVIDQLEHYNPDDEDDNIDPRWDALKNLK